MPIISIFEELENTSSRNAKEEILKERDTPLLRKILFKTYNPFFQYHVVKLSKVSNEDLKREAFLTENDAWEVFSNLLETLHERKITGNDAVHAVSEILYRANLSFPGFQKWGQRVLDRHLNVGVTSKSINKVFKKLIPEFKVQLAKKLDDFDRIKDEKLIGIEPKLDGVRCIAICENSKVTLLTRNGKNISDPYKDTIIADLEKFSETFGPSFVFDGELMGSNFTSTVSQIHRKSGGDVSDQKYFVFDFLPLDDWKAQKATMTCEQTRHALEDMWLDRFEYLRLVPRDVVENSKNNIQATHDKFVDIDYAKQMGLKEPLEGAMIKTLGTKYKFGRGWNVTKVKMFYDIDLKVVGFNEGIGKLEGKLGAIFVDYQGVRVKVGSGFTEEERQTIWDNRSKFRGMIAEVRYQEETPDKSLRFPTFRCWRPDKGEK